jgi:hypothetical protein
VNLYPLPPLILFESFGGNWELYQSALYKTFQDCILDKLTFLGLPVSCKFFEPINSRHRSFWHLISENPENSLDDEDRIPDFRRCERIKWIPHIINNCNDFKAISCWENTRGSNTNIV